MADTRPPGYSHLPGQARTATFSCRDSAACKSTSDVDSRLDETLPPAVTDGIQTQPSDPIGTVMVTSIGAVNAASLRLTPTAK